MFKFSDSADFLRQFKQGERPALEKVYLAYVDEVEATVRRFLIVGARSWGRSARVDVGDLVQELVEGSGVPNKGNRPATRVVTA